MRRESCEYSYIIMSGVTVLNFNEIYTSLSMVPADSSLRNAKAGMLFISSDSIGCADSFQEGGESGGEFDTTFFRLFRAAIIEREYIFARMRIATW